MSWGRSDREERRQGFSRSRLEEEGYGPILREAGLETSVSDEALACRSPRTSPVTPIRWGSPV